MLLQTFIVNLTTQSFFRHYKVCETDTKYNVDLLALLTPPDDETYAHWSRTDKIVICPTHLHSYVEKHYGELYLR